MNSGSSSAADRPQRPGHPPGRTARVAGLLYLLSTIAAVFSLIHVPGALIVPGNAAATAERIRASQVLYRVDIGVWSLAALLFTVLALVLFRLLQEVDRPLGLVMVALVLVQVPQVFVRQANQLAALLLVRGAGFLQAFDQPQREALAMLFLTVNAHGTIVAMTFWGLWLLPLGCLVYRSGFLPRTLGAWLVLNGAAYLANSATALLWPQHQDLVFRATLPALLGEVAFMGWLLAVGARPRLPARP